MPPPAKAGPRAMPSQFGAQMMSSQFDPPQMIIPPPMMPPPVPYPQMMSQPYNPNLQMMQPSNPNPVNQPLLPPRMGPPPGLPQGLSPNPSGFSLYNPSATPPTAKKCAACDQPKSDNQFYTYVRCPEHTDVVCYRCIQAGGCKACPKCQREYSSNEAWYLPTLIQSVIKLQ